MFPFELDKPICFFDLETTGTNIASDRIVSISVIKIFPSGAREIKDAIINPEMLIPAEATAIHGITNEMVTGKPTFRQFSKSIYAFMKECDLAGFNSNSYDIPMLAEHFLRCHIDFPAPDARFIDVMTIYKNKERRNLEAGYKFYCGKEMKNAHDSSYDIQVTFEIFMKQLQFYTELHQGIDFIHEFCQKEKKVDFAGKIRLDEDGDYIYNFGNAKGMKIYDDLRRNNKKAICWWMLKKDFPLNTKRMIQKIILEFHNPEYKDMPNFEEFTKPNPKANTQIEFEFIHNPNLKHHA